MYFTKLWLAFALIDAMRLSWMYADLVELHPPVDQHAGELAPPRQAVKLPLNWNTVRKRDRTHSPTAEYSVPNTHQSPVNLHLVYSVKCYKYSYIQLLNFEGYRHKSVTLQTQ